RSRLSRRDRRDRHGAQPRRPACRLCEPAEIRRAAPPPPDGFGNGTDRRPRRAPPAGRRLRHPFVRSCATAEPADAPRRTRSGRHRGAQASGGRYGSACARRRFRCGAAIVGRLRAARFRAIGRRTSQPHRVEAVAVAHVRRRDDRPRLVRAPPRAGERCRRRYRPARQPHRRGAHALLHRAARRLDRRGGGMDRADAGARIAPVRRAPRRARTAFRRPAARAAAPRRGTAQCRAARRGRRRRHRRGRWRGDRHAQGLSVQGRSGRQGKRPPDAARGGRKASCPATQAAGGGRHCPPRAPPLWPADERNGNKSLIWRMN
ncbi:unnamed protein product, partial [Adineta ricciae]